jgi:hypothetical protein
MMKSSDFKFEIRDLKALAHHSLRAQRCQAVSYYYLVVNRDFLLVPGLVQGIDHRLDRISDTCFHSLQLLGEARKKFVIFR